MTAAEIISEIKRLPPSEHGQVARFVGQLVAGRPWSGAKLDEMAEMLVNEDDPAKAKVLREESAAGFYGEQNA